MIERLASLAGEPKSRSPLASASLLVLAVAMVAVHVVQSLTFWLPSGQFRNLHLGFALLIGFLALIEVRAPAQRWRRALLWLCVALSVVATFYIHVEYRALTEVRSFLPSRNDMLIAGLLLVLALVLSGTQWGWTIPLLAVLGLVYGYFGQRMPGELLAHPGIAFNRLLGYTSIPYFQGLLGGLTSLSAGTIFMFMFFGGALKATGALEFIVRVAFAVGGRSRAGPALVAVLSSGLMGTVSGSTVANVASTGAMTIPLMKRYGFRGEFAGAVEAVASTGGQLTPPVMGLAAFLIVGMTGLAYNSVMLAAIAPAFIYYAYLMVSVHLRAVGQNLDARQAVLPDNSAGLSLRQTLARQWHLAAAIIVLVTQLVAGVPAGKSALLAIATLLVLDVVITVVVGRARLSAWFDAGSRVVAAVVQGARAGAMVATVIAVIGILIEVLTVTGFAQKLSFAMLELAGGNLLSLAIIVALSCLVFGLGLPTSAAYFVVAVFGAPALVEAGTPLLAAHMFVFYFANLSAITPPVAVASLVGANIAEASFWKTSFEAVRLALPGFLLPFLFLFSPEILGLGYGVGWQLLAVAKALLAIIALSVAVQGQLRKRVSPFERVFLVFASVGLLYLNVLVELVALAIIVAVFARGFGKPVGVVRA